MPDTAVIYLLQTPATDVTALRLELDCLGPGVRNVVVIDRLPTLRHLLLSSAGQAASSPRSKQRSMLVCWQISKRRLRERCQLLLRACLQNEPKAGHRDQLRNALPWQDDRTVSAAVDALLEAYEQASLDQNDLVQRLAKLAVELDHRYRQVLATADSDVLDLVHLPESADAGHVAALLAERRTAEDGHSFERLQQHFTNRIYASDKGRLRLDLILEDLQPMPGERASELQVLDVGCGEAPVSRRLLSSVGRLVLIEPSSGMLETALANVKRSLAALPPSGRVPVLETVNDFAQKALGRLTGQFDLILAHAVIEWTDTPLLLLEQICSRLAPDGRLSLAIYNEHGLRFRRLIRGQYEALPARPRPYRGGLTPVHPLTADEIVEWCRLNGFRIERLRGLRCFADYQQASMATDTDGASVGSPMATASGRAANEAPFSASLARYQQLLAAEREVSMQDPFRQLARYLHIIIRRNGT